MVCVLAWAAIQNTIGCMVYKQQKYIPHSSGGLCLRSSSRFAISPVSFWRTLIPSSEKAMAPHSSTLAWKIPWTEESGRQQSMGLLRVRHDRATSLSLFTFTRWRRKCQPTPLFLPGESQGWGSLMGCRHGVAQSRTRLKWLSSSSSSSSNSIMKVPPSWPNLTLITS